MTERTYGVGDVVAWDEVPDEALVLWNDDTYLVFQPKRIFQAHYPSVPWMAPEGEGSGRELWAHMAPAQVTIIALNLTGQETAADLQRLAEVYEVREVLTATLIEPRGPYEPAFWLIGLPCGPGLFDHKTEDGEDGITAMEVGSGTDRDVALQAAAERLHAAGWRPRDSAARAAELLAAEAT
jgi:hypothetical protein